MSDMPPLSQNQMAVVQHGSPVEILDDLDLSMVVYHEIDTMSYQSRRMLPSGVVPSIAGYCEIFLVKDVDKYFAYHEDVGGSSRSVGYDTASLALTDLAATLSRAHRYWRQQVRWAENGDRDQSGRQVIRCDGTCYIVGKEPPKGQRLDGLGFGGARWHFRLTDGTEVVSHNLWHQGRIPIEYRDQLPDNAVLIPNPPRGVVL